MTTVNPDDTRRSRRRILLAGAALSVAALAAATAVALTRRERPSNCAITLLEERPAVETSRRRDQPVEDNDAQWDPLLITDWDHDRYWQFVSTGTTIDGSYRGHSVMEGVIKPWSEADVRNTWWSEGEPNKKNRTREVVIPGKQWHETARSGERTHCPVDSRWRMKRIIPERFDYAEPDQVGTLTRPIAGEHEKGRLIGEDHQDGDPLRVYELSPNPYAPRVRTTVSLDAANRIRKLQVHDPAHDTVVLDLTVRPAPPDQPPIGDPTGQPIVSTP